MKSHSKTPLIVIAYASTGSGHQIAAQAIADQFNNCNVNVNIKLIDILDYYNGKVSGNDFVNVTSGHLASFFDFTWRKNFTGRILWGGGKLWPSVIFKKFEDYIKFIQPDAVICTHFVCSNTVAKARLKMDKKFFIVSVPTDYETEGFWPHKETDLFCVATHEMLTTLKARKVEEYKIKVSGIPVSTDFRKNYNKSTLRAKFGLAQDKKIAVVVAGANLAGPYNNIRKVINKCIRYFAKLTWMHFVICVGKDRDYEKKLKYKIEKIKATNITILSYINNFSQLLKAADIALVKPGGLCVTECACINLPLLLIGKTYAQESINRRYLTALRAAVHTTTYYGVINLLCDIFSNPKYYETLKNNCKNLCVENSAKIIVDSTLNLLNKPLLKRPKFRFNIYIGNAPVHTRW